MVTTNLLAAGFDVAFDHKTFYKCVKFWIDSTAMKNFASDTNLLIITFVRVRVVCIDDNCWVFQVLCLIFFEYKTKIFVMIVWNCFAVFVYSATKD